MVKKVRAVLASSRYQSASLSFVLGILRTFMNNSFFEYDMLRSWLELRVCKQLVVLCKVQFNCFFANYSRSCTYSWADSWVRNFLLLSTFGWLPTVHSSSSNLFNREGSPECLCSTSNFSNWKGWVKKVAPVPEAFFCIFFNSFRVQFRVGYVCEFESVGRRFCRTYWFPVVIQAIHRGMYQRSPR